jgi:hypothetical protein
MRSARVRFLYFASVALSLMIVVVGGCSKKADEPAAASASQQAATAPADAQPAATDQAAQAPSGPVLDSSQMVGDAKAAMADADAAVRQREYEKAVKTMLAIQQAQLNAEQAAAARQQMINLQRTLANAIASGDPNAVAAGEMLRAAHRH